ncbi:hypothetical protein CATYP_06735 [Corynebacterium atypicum]|uniref:Uncharacterized protein n=1 Tax=Corynebacterium atypicum TaxID=191610 RepID=A0ABN4DFZ0_9CORY|nr:hypothetical protein CATYP_06735 [Corynebacterium atypicum]
MEATPTYRLGDDDGTAKIQIAEGDTQAAVLAEAYRFALERGGIGATVEVVGKDDPRSSAGELSWLADGGAGVIVGCTGQLMAQADADGAARLQAALKAEEAAGSSGGAAGSGDAPQQTYDALMGVLPGDFDLPDPSPAEGCSTISQPGEADDERLPQNVVPVYRKINVSRWGKKSLNDVTRLLTTHELAEMIERVEAGDAPQDVVTEWIGESNSDLLK